MIAYYYGEDTYGAREAILERAQEEQAVIRWIEARELAQEPLAMLVQQGRGLFGRQVLVVLDPSEAPSAAQQDIVAVVQEKKGDVILWDRGEIDKRSTLWRSVRDYATVFAPLSPPQLSAWLVSQAQQRGGQVSSEVALLLIARLGTNRWRLLSELERLLLQYPMLTAAAIEGEVDASVMGEIFVMLDALAQGAPRRTIEQLERLLASGNSEFYLLTMLAYQFRTLLVVAVGLAEGKTQQALAREAKLHPYVVEKNMAIARRLSPTILIEALTRIMATDYAIKEGRVEARTALVMLVLNLVRQQQRVLARA